MNREALAAETYQILTSDRLTYQQKLIQLAKQAENSLEVLKIPERFEKYFKTRALCDMNEGNAPYRPRYVMVDFDRYIRQGSDFLNVKPPETLDQAIFALMMLYCHIPSITTMPVYIGDLDRLLDPFLTGLSDQQIKEKLKLFLNYIDRTIPDGYCHANLGPKALRATKLLLECEQELNNAVPNFTFKYDLEETPEELMEQVVLCALACANPAIANHKAHRDTYLISGLPDGDTGFAGYGVSSCYNVLPLRGGSYILSRIVIPRLAQMAENIEQFLTELLPEALQGLGEYMDERIRFLVEESGFFQSSFLVQEGLIERENFTGMFGVAGLCNGVNYLLREQDKRYGRDAEADDLAEQIMTVIADFAASYPAKYCEVSGGHYYLHAQAGLSTDEGVTSGVRIVVGEEPERLYDHLRHSARFHKFFPTGCSDIFPFEMTAQNNPAAILDIIKGAFSIGDKYLAIYRSDSDLVRITGYLAKRSDIEKYDRGEVVLQDTVQNGSTNYKLNRLGERKVRSAAGHRLPKGGVTADESTDQ